MPVTQVLFSIVVIYRVLSHSREVGRMIQAMAQYKWRKLVINIFGSVEILSGPEDIEVGRARSIAGADARARYLSPDRGARGCQGPSSPALPPR